MTHRHWTAPDPGPDARLGPDARAELSGAIKSFARGAHPAVLIEVTGDAWAQPADAPGTPDDRERTEVQHLVAALYRLPCPVVLSLSGAVTGLGLALALCADVRVLSANATFAVGDRPHAALLGAGRWLAGQCGATAAFDRMAWVGDRIDAAEALSAGVASATGDVSVAATAAARLADDPGWALLKRANRSSHHAELAEQLRYAGWLADICR